MRVTSHERWLSAAALTAAGALVLVGAGLASSQTSQESQPGQTAQPGGTAQPDHQMMHPGQADQADQSMPQSRRTLGTTDATSPAGQKTMSSQELRRHARAHVMVEQKAPDVHAKLATVKDVTNELSAEEQQKLREALEGTGITFQQFARQHREITANPQTASQLKHMEEQVKAQAGKQQPAGTSGGATSPGGQEAQPGAPGARQPGGGAAAPAPQPGASPTR